MTEPDDSTQDGTAEPASRLAEALESLKRARGNADDHPVTNDAPTRINWSSVTDDEDEQPQAAEPAERPSDAPSFQFDLGNALARLGGETRPDDGTAPPPLRDQPPTTGELLQPPAADPLPQRTAPPVPTAETAATGSDPLPQRTAPPAPTVETTATGADPLPQRTAPPVPSAETASTGADPLPQRTTSPAPPVPTGPDPLPQRSAAVAPAVHEPITAHQKPVEPIYRPSSAPPGSVFDAAAPAPSLPTQAPRTSHPQPSAPVIPPGAVANLPTLPPPAPSNPTPVIETEATGPAAPDIHAVRSYQLKAKREQRRGRVFGRTLIALILLGGAVAAAMTFGRSYLFPTEWDASLTPIVNEVQDGRGGSFVDTVDLEVLPVEEYVPVALGLTVGTEWSERLPEWRALGVATGGADAQAITDAVVAWRPAIYDAEAGKIVQLADGDPEATTAALTLAMEQAFDDQQGISPNDGFEGSALGVVGVSPLPAVNSHAIDRELLVGPGTFEPSDESQAPLPLLYEFAAIDALGAPLVAAAGEQAASWTYGDTYPDEALAATSVSANRAVVGAIPDGAESLAAPVALGLDNWSMIWENRLPAQTVERLQTLVTADAYVPVQRGESQCFVAWLQAASETGAADVLGSMARWIANGPPEAAATATLVDSLRVEVFACDPGAEVGYVVDARAVNALVERQIARL